MGNPKGTPENLTSYSPKWQSGRTQVVRVPVVLTEQILNYARLLDSQIEQPGKTIDKDSLLQVIHNLEQLLETPRNNFSKERRELLRTSVDKLKSLVTVKDSN